MDDSTIDIGALLKERRVKLGYSLADVSERIRIRKVYLENIEENNFSSLPGKVYLTGFVDIYSRFLGLDSKSILASLPVSEASDPSHVGIAPSTKKFDGQFNASPAAKGWRTFWWAFLLVLAIGLAAFFLPSVLDNPAPVKPVAPSDDQGIEQPKNNQVEDKAVAIPDEGPAKEDKAVEEPRQPPEDVVTTIEEPIREPLPVIPPEGASLRMLALAKGSIIINVDNRKLHEYALHDGLDLTWKIKREVSAEMSRADVARFWLDGVELELSGVDNFALQSSPEE